MLDDSTRARCKHAAEMALRDGRDLFETLEKAGLLVTRDRQREIEIDTVHTLLAQLDQSQPFILAGFGGDQTVTGAVRGVVKFVELFAKSLQG